MHMLFVRDVFLVEVVQLDLLLAVGGSKKLEKITLKLVAEVVDVFSWVLADQQHLSDVGFGLRVHFEAVFVPALLFAYL